MDNSKLQRDEAVNLLSRALRGVIARNDTQRLADAIAADPSILDSVEMQLNYVS